MMDCPGFLVLDYLIPNVYTLVPACKLHSSSVDLDCLVLSPPSTSASEMNIRSSLTSVSSPSCVLNTPHVAVQQVMNSDATLNSVIISETKSSKSHFHILCYLTGRH